MTHDELKNRVIDYLAGKVTCRAFTEAVTDYLEGTLGLRDWIRMQMHLGLCLGCRRYLKQMRTTVRTLGSLPAEPIPAPVRDELLRRFRTWKTRRES